MTAITMWLDCRSAVQNYYTAVHHLQEKQMRHLSSSRCHDRTFMAIARSVADVLRRNTSLRALPNLHKWTWRAGFVPLLGENVYIILIFPCVVFSISAFPSLN